MEYITLGFILLIAGLMLFVVHKKRRPAGPGFRDLKLVQEPSFEMRHAETEVSKPETKKLKLQRPSVSKQAKNNKKVSKKKK
jgi:hypothetical protein